MSAEHYRGLLVKQWWIIAICIIVMEIGVSIGTRLVPLRYESTATVEVDVPSTNFAIVSLVDGADKYVYTGVQLATTTTVLSAVVTHYPGLTVSQLGHEVTAHAVINTELFTITVADPSATRAASLANDIAATVIAQQNQAMERDNAQALSQIEQRVAATQDEISQTTAALNQLQASAAAPAQVTATQTKLTNLQIQYYELVGSMADLGQYQATTSSYMHIAQPAQPSSHPVQSYSALYYGSGVAIGLLLGILLIVVRDQLDQRVRTSRAVTDLLEWPVLAEFGAPSETKNGDRPVHASPGVSAVPYRSLDTNLGFLAVSKPLHSIAVMGTMLGEGPSVVAANLALYLAQSNRKTLLVDADLGHPTQSARFGVTAEAGLSNAALAFHASGGHDPELEQFVHQAITINAPTLRIVPAGTVPPNPTRLLKSEAMCRVVEAVNTSGAETVVFSAAPVNRLAQAQALAPLADGVVVMIDLAKARRDNLVRAKRLLAEAGVSVLGCVVAHGDVGFAGNSGGASDVYSDRSMDEREGNLPVFGHAAAAADPAESSLK